MRRRRNTRCWWLKGVRTGPSREAVAEVIDSFYIETLAAGYGAILRGRDLVEKHFRIFDEVLASLDGSVQPSRYVDRF